MESGLLQLLGDHPAVALAVTDASGRVTLSTPALERMLGRRVESFTEREMASFGACDPMGGRTLGVHELPLARAVRGEVVVDEVLRLTRSDGRTVYLRCSAAPLREEGHAVGGAIVLVYDVTVEWLALRKQAELRDRLVSVINHELRTPLTKILGHTELLVGSVDAEGLPSAASRSLAAIARAGDELGRLVRRLSDLADLEAAAHLDPASLDLVTVLVEEVEAAERLREDVSMLLDAPGELPVTMDRSRVSWAVRELLDNAVRHAPAGSKVLVEAVLLDGHVEIIVTDAGEGISEDDRERVLHPFERSSSADRSSSSPGVGLAAVAAVAAAHGGSITLEDADPHGLRARLDLRRHV